MIGSPEGRMQVDASTNRIRCAELIQNLLFCICNFSIFLCEYAYSQDALIGSRDAQIFVEIQRIGAVNEPCLSIVEDDLMLGVMIVGRNIENRVYCGELEVTALDNAGDIRASSYEGDSEGAREV